MQAHKPVEVSFHIVLPSGKTLTRFRTGAGPHTGVHLILVRDDLSVIVHRHPKIQPDGTVRQSITFPKPGKYHVLVDVYPIVPDTPQLVNFQLTTERDREGRASGRSRCRRTAPRSRSAATGCESRRRRASPRSGRRS